MGQPGSGNILVKRSLIIDGRQTQGRRILEYFVTAAGWAYVLLFLTQVIFSLILWSVGIEYIKRFIVSTEYYTMTITLVIFTLVVASIVLSLSLFWSYYNKAKFGKLNRRKMPTAVSLQELSEMFSISEECLCDLQTMSWIELEGEMEQIQENLAGRRNIHHHEC